MSSVNIIITKFVLKKIFNLIKIIHEKYIKTFIFLPLFSFGQIISQYVETFQFLNPQRLHLTVVICKCNMGNEKVGW